MKIIVTGLVLLVCLSLSCGSGNHLRGFNPEKRLFESPEYGCRLQLPNMPGWEENTRRDADDIVFEAHNPSKILYVFLGAEPLNSELEDYYLLLKVSNKLESKEKFQLYGKSREDINGMDALRFVYSAEIQDEQIGTQRFVYVNVLFRKDKMNYRLIVYTLSDAYERKKNLIEKIIDGFTFL